MATIFVRSPLRPLQLPPCCVRLFAHAYSEARPGDLIHGEAMDATQISGNRTSARSPSGCRAADCASYPLTRSPRPGSALGVLSRRHQGPPASALSALGATSVLWWSCSQRSRSGWHAESAGLSRAPIPYPSSWPLAWTTSATVWLPVRPRPAKVPAAFTASNVPLTTWLRHPAAGLDSYRRHLWALREYEAGPQPEDPIDKLREWSARYGMVILMT